MKTMLLGLLLISSPALAEGKCYQLEGKPSWTVLYEPKPSDLDKPALIWNQAGKVINLGTYGTGTDTGSLMAAPLDAADGDKAFSFDVRDSDGALILDKGVYRPGCK